MLPHTPVDEVLLLARMGRQDASALQELYSHFAKPLYSWALRSLGSEEDAEEALQDAFRKYWEKASTFDPSKSKPFTWAMMILRGICLDRQRKVGRLARNRQQWLAEVDTSEYESPMIVDELDDDTVRVLNALAALPKPERRAIEMAVFLEVPYAQIASETGDPLGTVKSRIRRGLLRLRQVLKHHDR